MQGLAKTSFPQLQKGHRLARGLIAAWDFYEGAGSTTLNDITENRYAGTISGAPSWVGGPFGSTLSFNGTSQYATIQNFNPSAIFGG